MVSLQSGYHSVLCQGEPGSIKGREIIYLGRGVVVVFRNCPKKRLWLKSCHKHWIPFNYQFVVVLSSYTTTLHKLSYW